MVGSGISHHEGYPSPQSPVQSLGVACKRLAVEADQKGQDTMYVKAMYRGVEI